ncbi:hypothetical protein NPX13_g10575 [Xylaria arbuscula]|uniref:Uncharacterized protein n=1 Tax=Xylaria arbuscula TaxID=114810 RepID=A0A9W8N4F8_9PEZI|nr:hypothetical protein NPX13_g10575 [Xylaria arbuscula]
MPLIQPHQIDKAATAPITATDGGGPHMRAGNGIHCTIYLSIAAVTIWGDMDWRLARMAGIDCVQHVTGQETWDDMKREFFRMGRVLLAELAVGTEITEIVCTPEDPHFFDCKVYSVPDKEVEGGTFMLYLVALNEETDETHVIEHGNRVTDVATSLIPQFEAMAKTCNEKSRLRGAMVLLEEDGSWKSLYWDGIRWVNLVFFEWQTPDSLAYVWEY